MKIPWPSLKDRVYSKKSAKALDYSEIMWFFEAGILVGRADISPQEKAAIEEKILNRMLELFPERRNKVLSATAIEKVLSAKGLSADVRLQIIGEVFGG